MFVDTTVAELKLTPRNAIHNSQGTKLHRLKSSQINAGNNENVRVAFPNDRACSIRPSDRKENYKSVYNSYDDLEHQEIERCSLPGISTSDSAHFAYADLSCITTKLWDGAIILHMNK